jgi:hypothetical protein
MAAIGQLERDHVGDLFLVFGEKDLCHERS